MTFSTLIYALIAGLLPSLIWLWFWTREDANTEPKSLIAGLFVGGVVAVIAAVFAERFIASLGFDPSLQYTLWAAVEEIFKFIAVAVIALNSDYNDEPIDAMIYCIVAALGFAALENTLFLLTPLSSGLVAQSLVTGNMRFIGATLVHIVSTATIGFGLGYAYYKGYLAKTIAIIVGLLTAITFHAAFNLSIINGTTNDTLRAFAWVWGAVVLLMVLFEEVKVVKPKSL